MEGPDKLPDSPDVQIHVNIAQSNSIEEDTTQTDVRSRDTAERDISEINTRQNDITSLEEDQDTEPLLGRSESDNNRETPAVDQGRQEALSFWKALRLPGVLMYAFAYFCLKLVNYSFFFWLPYYLHNAFGWTESKADTISIWYDIGGIIGGTVAGIISDCFQKRSVVVVPMLVLAIPSLVVYNNSPNDMNMNAFLMTLTGFFIGGVANLISAAISADLGKQGPIQGNKAALATVTGIVDGTGSVGAALGQLLVPLIQENLGWRSVFYLFILMTVLTIFCILPMFVRETIGCYRDTRGVLNRYSYSWYCGVHKPRSDSEHCRIRSASSHSLRRDQCESRRQQHSKSSSVNTYPSSEEEVIKESQED